MAKAEKNISTNTAPGLIQTIYRGNATTRFIHNESNYVLEPGQAYDLPADCNYVQALVAQQILQTLN